MKLLIKWLICVGTLLAFYGLFPRLVTVSGGMLPLVAAATLLWLINLLIRPVLQVLSLPFTILTLGLFSLIVNAAMVSLADALIPGLSIHGFGMCLFIALILSVANWIFAAKRWESRS